MALRYASMQLHGTRCIVRLTNRIRLANLVLPPPGIRFKASSMPFTQRENISQFLTACEKQPLMLPAHDRFLTVDLYDSKDPAQVLQCISAFSRAANAAKPTIVRTAIGPKRGGAASPTRQMFNGDSTSSGRSRGFSNTSQENTINDRRALSPALTGGSNTSSATRTSGTPVSSWSKKSDEYSSAPAWNIHQYGYMGGASQGNQGISFGARRQITTPQVSVPSLAEKERRRKEQEVDTERQRQDEEKVERQRRLQREDSERQERIAEQERWEDETRKARDKERQQLELDRKRWEEEEKRWQEDDARRKKEQEQEDTRLNGGFLSQYQAEQQAKEQSGAQAENSRILELERQLAEAKERERQYQLEKESRLASQPRTPETPEQSPDAYRRPDGVSTPTRQVKREANRDSWVPDEREELRRTSRGEQASGGSPAVQPLGSSRPLPNPEAASSLQATPQSMRPVAPLSAPQAESQPVPPPAASAEPPAPPVTSRSRPTSSLGSQRPLPPSAATENQASSRSPFERPTSSAGAPSRNLPPFSSSPATVVSPLPDSSTAQPSQPRNTYSSPKPSPFTRTDRFLASNPAPVSSSPRTNFPAEMGMTSESERAGEDARRVQSQQKTKAGGWASKSLLEREMERERERQREWEEQQIAKNGARAGGGLMGPRELKR